MGSKEALDLVKQLKHLPGKHPQKSHSGGRYALGSDAGGSSKGEGNASGDWVAPDDMSSDGIKRWRTYTDNAQVEFAYEHGQNLRPKMAISEAELKDFAKSTGSEIRTRRTSLKDPIVKDDKALNAKTSSLELVNNGVTMGQVTRKRGTYDYEPAAIIQELARGNKITIDGTTHKL